jgi:hypothetical protein
LDAFSSFVNAFKGLPSVTVNEKGVKNAFTVDEYAKKEE